MKILLASDFHGNLPDPKKIPSGQLFLSSGDLFPNWSMNWRYDWASQLNWCEDVFEPWLKQLKVEKYYVCSGNHDGLGEISQFYKRDYVINDREVVFRGLKIYGTPWTRAAFNPSRWAHGMNTDDELEKVWDNIPDDVDILVSHSPAYGILDLLPPDEYLGSKTLLARLDQLKNLKLHTVGHLHEAKGFINHGRYTTINAATGWFEFDTDTGVAKEIIL